MTQIVVNHLTRMAHPRICVAGVETESGRLLRPITAKDDLLTRKLLVEEGGPLQLGARVELGATVRQFHPPETEDCFCVSSRFRRLGAIGRDEYLELIDGTAEDSLADAFGPELERCGKSYAIAPGEGAHSLGCVRVDTDLRLAVNFDKPRLVFAGASIGVTDLRLFEADQRTVRSDVVEDINARLAGECGLG